MASMTVDCGSFNKTSYSGVTQYGTLVNFTIPEGAVISACSVSFTTHAAGGDTADRAFSINGVRAHTGWASNGALTAGLLRAGNNTFRATLKSQTPSGSGGTSCIWNISNITLIITYSVSGGSTPPPVGGGGPVVISPSSIDAGAGSITVTCPAEAGIWHMIDWTFGSQSGQWSHPWEAGGTGTISVPLSWISELPYSTSGILAIRVRRSTTPAMPYSYATDQTTNITIKVPESIVPTISSFTETLASNGVPETISGYVQGKSKVALDVIAAAGSYSSLSSMRITGGGIDVYAASGTFGPFYYSGDITFTATATDTRGRAASRQVAISVMPYSAPGFISSEAWRSDVYGAKNQKGTYARLKSGLTFASLEGQNSATLKGRVYLKGGTAPAWESMTPDTAWITGGGSLLNTRTYVAQLIVQDKITSKTIEFIIPTKKTGLSIMAGMQGAAVGKPAETPGIFESAWPIYNPNGRCFDEKFDGLTSQYINVGSEGGRALLINTGIEPTYNVQGYLEIRGVSTTSSIAAFFTVIKFNYIHSAIMFYSATQKDLGGALDAGFVGIYLGTIQIFIPNLTDYPMFNVGAWINGNRTPVTLSDVGSGTFPGTPSIALTKA